MHFANGTGQKDQPSTKPKYVLLVHSPTKQETDDTVLRIHKLRESHNNGMKALNEEIDKIKAVTTQYATK